MVDLKVLMVEKEDCDAGTVQQLRSALVADRNQVKILRDAADTLKKRLTTVQPDAAKRLHLKLGISLAMATRPCNIWLRQMVLWRLFIMAG